MRIVYIVVLSFLFVTCKKKKEQVEESNNGVKSENVVTSKDKSNDIDYNLENFEDTKKTFSILGESYESYKKTLFINDVFYTAAILPKKYYLKKYFKGDSLAFYEKKMEREEIIQFDFQHLDKKDLLESTFSNRSYEEGVKYLAFHIKNDFYGVTENLDTIIPSGVFFERSFKLKPYKRVLIYFNGDKKIKNIKLIYHDKLFRNGILKFNLKNTLN